MGAESLLITHGVSEYYLIHKAFVVGYSCVAFLFWTFLCIVHYSCMLEIEGGWYFFKCLLVIRHFKGAH